MGYFSNGCEGLDWEILWCNRCVHEPPNDADWDCAVHSIQLMFNYAQLKKGVCPNQLKLELEADQ